MNPKIANARERLIYSANVIALGRRDHDFTISKAAEKRGIGIGILCHYFENRDDLATQILAYERNIVFENMDRTMSRDRSPYGNENISLNRYARLSKLIIWHQRTSQNAVPGWFKSNGNAGEKCMPKLPVN